MASMLFPACMQRRLLALTSVVYVVVPQALARLLGFGAYRRQSMQASVTVFALLGLWTLVVVMRSEAQQKFAGYAVSTFIFAYAILSHVLVFSKELREDARQLAEDLATLSSAPATATPRGTAQLASLFSHWEQWRRAITAWLVPASRGMRRCDGRTERAVQRDQLEASWRLEARYRRMMARQHA
jgi:hypothetical protein